MLGRIILENFTSTVYCRHDENIHRRKRRNDLGSAPHIHVFHYHPRHHTDNQGEQLVWKIERRIMVHSTRLVWIKVTPLRNTYRAEDTPNQRCSYANKRRRLNCYNPSRPARPSKTRIHETEQQLHTNYTTHIIKCRVKCAEEG